MIKTNTYTMIKNTSFDGKERKFSFETYCEILIRAFDGIE